MQFVKYSRSLLQIGLIGFSSFVVFSSVTMSPAFAAKQAAETQQVSAKVGKPLQEARALMEAKKWKEALVKIKEVVAIPGKTPAEEAIVNQMQAFSLVNLKDYANAVIIYEKMLDAGQFKKEEVAQQILTISQMHYSLKNYPKSIQFAERYLKETGNSNLDVLHQIAQTYYIQNDFARTEQATQTLLKAAQQQGKPIQEKWLQLLLSAQHKQNKKADVIATLERLLVSFPSKQYWSDMLKYVASESTFTDRQTINFLRLKQAIGQLDASGYVEMAELSLAVTSPGDAKSALEEGFAKGILGVGTTKDRETKLLNLAKKQAAEDIALLPSIDKEAQAKPTGEALVKIGEAYLGHGQYENAIAALRKGLAKGGIKNQDDVNINIGIAYLGLKKQGDAIKSFKAVPASSKISLLARLWAVHAASVK